MNDVMQLMPRSVIIFYDIPSLTTEKGSRCVEKEANLRDYQFHRRGNQMKVLSSSFVICVTSLETKNKSRWRGKRPSLAERPSIILKVPPWNDGKHDDRNFRDVMKCIQIHLKISVELGRLQQLRIRNLG
ncbi:hypothetical protein JTB14_037463 [Gonioctena quinquepunctata]|nr:hypothetical protein JTB14_037463 [Gonioctena quinquepunctata]